MLCGCSCQGRRRCPLYSRRCQRCRCCPSGEPAATQSHARVLRRAAPERGGSDGELGVQHAGLYAGVGAQPSAARAGESARRGCRGIGNARLTVCRVRGLAGVARDGCDRRSQPAPGAHRVDGDSVKPAAEGEEARRAVCRVSAPGDGGNVSAGSGGQVGAKSPQRQRGWSLGQCKT